MMNPYKITDRCLPFLAIANILLIGPLIWAMWWPLSFGWTPHTGDMTPWVVNRLVYGIGIGVIISCVTARAFFKKWRYMLILYIPYSIYQFPGIFLSLKNYADHKTFSSFYLPGRIWTYSLTALLVATLLVCAIYILERILWRRKSTRNIKV